MKKLNIKQKGFTMIELIIVIAILGILAAFALPRFANFTTEANAAARAGVVGALNSASGIAKAKYVAQGSTGTVTLDGGTAITMSATGVDFTGITSAALCQTLVTALLGQSNGLTVALGTSGTSCSITGTGSSWSAITLNNAGAS